MDFGKLSSALCFSCSGATLLNCCILSTTSSATRIFDPASGGIFEVGEEQVPGCVAGWKDNVVWEQPLRVFTRGGENTRALLASFKHIAELPRELLGSLPLQQPKPDTVLQQPFLEEEANNVFSYYLTLYLITTVTVSGFCATVEFRYLYIHFRGRNIKEGLA